MRPVPGCMGADRPGERLMRGARGARLMSDVSKDGTIKFSGKMRIGGTVYAEKPFPTKGKPIIPDEDDD